MSRDRILSLLATTSLIALTGCAGGQPEPPATTADPASSVVILGTLTYRERIALPAQGRAVVELREGTTEDGRLITAKPVDLGGKQVPIAFSLEAPRAMLVAGNSYTVRGAVFDGGRPAWVSESKSLKLGANPSVNAGPLNMVQAKPGAFRSVFNCGSETAIVSWGEDAGFLTFGGETFELKREESASGARYASASDPSTFVWNKGEETTVSVRGRQLVNCSLGVPASAPFKAHGNEPSWSFAINGSTMSFSTVGGTPVNMATPNAEASSGGRRYSTSAGDQPFVANILDRRCTDTMSGMTYPNTVNITWGGREFRGCGGDPSVVLQGEEWVVESVNEKPLASKARATILFGPDGRLSGKAPCNGYSSTYRLTGEGITFSNPISTLKACTPEIDADEKAFFEVLRNVNRFQIAQDGALVLIGADDRKIRARR